MAAPLTQMLTANRLRDGDVLYWKAGAWVEVLADAEVFTDKPSAEAALAAAQKSIEDCVVVGTYLFEVRLDAAGIHPVKEREIVRAAGPTVRRDLGKQASLTVDPPLSEAHRASPRPQGEGGNALEGFDVSL